MNDPIASTVTTSVGDDSVARARELFEIPDGVTYLNCANMAPQMRAITDSGIHAVRARATPWKWSDWFSRSEELRALAARIFGASSDGVALVPAASYGSPLLRRTCRSRRDRPY